MADLLELLADLLLACVESPKLFLAALAFAIIVVVVVSLCS